MSVSITKSLKTAVVSVVGRPSVGKSSLVNRVCGQDISIVSPHPQTTRRAVRGIFSDERGQLIFLDTPGYHRSERAYNAMLRSVVRTSLSDSECVLYVLDTCRLPGSEEQELINLLTKQELPVVLAYNKCDLAASDSLRQALATMHNSLYHRQYDVSAETGQGIEALVDCLFALGVDTEANELPYPTNVYTDQDPEFRVAEIIREQAILRARRELPHAIMVTIQDMRLETREGSAEGDSAPAHSSSSAHKEYLKIRAQICVESPSQVALVVGKEGQQIREIRQQSQRRIGRVFPYRVHLDLRVKSIGKWRKERNKKYWN